MISINQSLVHELTEKLAAVEHERWSHWQRYMHGKCKHNLDGSLVIPPDLVEQWNRQFSTPYGGLAELEKGSDRDQVRRYLPLILDTLEIRVTDDDAK